MAKNELFDTSIKVTGSFGAAGAFPVDGKYVVETIDERNDHVTQNRAYEGMLVYVKADGVTYQYTKEGWRTFGTSALEEEITGIVNDLVSGDADKALSAQQGKVLKDALDEHTEDTTVHVTADEKAAWNAKAETKEDVGLGNVTNDAQVKRTEMGVAGGVATLDEDGLVPASQLPSYVDDILEADTFESLPETGVAGKIFVTLDDNKTYRWSGTQYVEISSSLALGETADTAYAGNKGKANAEAIANILSGDTTVAHATDADTVNGLEVLTAVPADAVFTDTVYTHPDTHDASMIVEDDDHKFVTQEILDKIDTIEEGANTYVHPNTHPATMIEEDDDHKFITQELLTKLDGIDEGATNYTHPATHAATMITTDETHRFVTDEEKSTWNAKAGTDVVTDTVNGLMSYIDKQKLDGIEEGANAYVHPESHAATMITTDASHQFVTDVQISKINAIPDAPKYTDTTYDEASGTTAGLMSAADKAKLDTIDQNANAYVHPDTHDAAMIVEDATHKFVTEEQITAWEAKADVTEATSDTAGLMSAEDKAKLDAIEEGATNYTHPDTHDASMIVEDATHKFVTEEQIEAWNAKADTKEDVGLGNVTNDAQVKRTEMGTAGGVATLDENGFVPSSQLPSYVDDIIDVDDFASLPETGESGKIYVTTDDNKTYRWSGTQYVEISSSLAIGETSSTAYAGDKGKANADAIANILSGDTTVAHASDADSVNGLTVLTAVPENAVFTDTTYEEATTDAAGLMSAEDKAKLDDVEEGANNYVHPDTHPATMIVEDATHKFVTEEQLTDLATVIANANPSTGLVELNEETSTVEINSLALDKNLLLDGVAAEAKSTGDRLSALEARIAALEALLKA